MSAPRKLAGFAAVLAMTFTAAALAGDAIGPVHDTPPKAAPHGATMGHGGGEAHGAPQPLRGLAVSDGGLTLSLNRAAAPRRARFALSFRVLDRDGHPVHDFDVEHTKRMHLIVVRRDLTGFQHLHPTQAGDGTWSVPVRLLEAGTYRVFADFSADGKAYTLADDLAVDGPVRSRQLPAPATSAEVDGLTVRRTSAGSQVGFTVTRGGRPVALQQYLGAKGHLVALRKGDLAFLHVHPDEDRLRFTTSFPTAGDYRLFLQFQVAGRVHTAAFTEAVTR
jgi:hypothetical protein